MKVKSLSTALKFVMYHGKLNQMIRGNTNYFANLQISQRSSRGQILIIKKQIPVYSLINANFPTYILTLKADKHDRCDGTISCVKRGRIRLD